MNSKDRGAAVIPFRRHKRTADLLKPTCVPAGAEGTPPDRDGSPDSVTASRSFSPAQRPGAEPRESTPHAKPPASGIPPTGPRSPLVHVRPQPSAQIVLYAAILAILIVWFGVIAAIAAWSNPK